MPGKGNPRLVFRIEGDLLEAVIQAIRSCNRHRSEEPYTVSSFCLSCIRERLAKMKRSREWKRKGKERKDSA